MTIEKTQIAIKRVLLVGVLTSFIVVLIGGILYLLKYSGDIIHYQAFHGEPINYSIIDVFKNALTLSPQGIIQFGIFILVFVQILRVGVTAWMFIQSREKIFIYICSFIFFVLVYSLIWP